MEAPILRPQIASCMSGQLARDLLQLRKVHEIHAPEAAVFYCARILEAASAQSLRILGLEPHNTLLSNLDLLQQFDLMPAPTQYWSHALRRLGNDARHILRDLNDDDADQAMTFAERLLTWFFCLYPLGPQLPSLTLDAAPLFHLADQSLHDLIVRCDRPDSDPGLLYTDLHQHARLMATPALPAVIGDFLLQRADVALALDIIQSGLAKFALDPRLLQLAALCYSRQRAFQPALAILEPLHRRFPGDPENAGILGGVYKRLSTDAEPRLQWLQKSHDAYHHGWLNSHETSAYLGINSATTLLWLGSPAESRQIAQTVRSLLQGRADILSKFLPDPISRMQFWQRVILAEANLLLGDLPSARDHYSSAFHDNPQRIQDIQSARAQATRILKDMHGSSLAEQFWKDPSPSGTRP